MSFWKKVTRRNSSGSVHKSRSCPGLKADREGRHTDGNEGSAARFGSNRGPLTDFYPDENETCVDLGQAQPAYQSSLHKSSRLSRSLQEFLNDPPSLGYLIQYLEGRDADHLVKFYLAVHSFRSSATTKLTSSYLPPQVDRGRLERVPEHSSIDAPPRPSAETRLPLPPSSPYSVESTDIKGSHLASESTDSFDSGFSKSDYDLAKTESEGPLSPTTSTGIGGLDGPLHDHEVEPGLLSPLDGRPERDTDSLVSADTISDSNQDYVFDKEDSRAQNLLRNRTEDAVKIYRRYIAPDSSTPIHISTEMNKQIVEHICDESGLVSSDCFDNAQSEVLRTLEQEYYPDFLESEYHAKHQVDVLTGGTVTVSDILYNDIALFHFMEFMESEGHRSLVEFWISANNFQQSMKRGEDLIGGETTHDAMILYDKYISMQATNPLGFDDKIRLEVENNICQETGPGVHCFSRPLEIVVLYLQTRYLHKFLQSKLFNNYVKELIATIQISTRNFSSVPRCVSVESLSSCSSDTTSSRVSHCNSARNTLLATSDPFHQHHTHTKSPSTRLEERFSIDYGLLTDPDSIWKRKPVKSTGGKVDSLGRYHSNWEQPPDLNKDKSLLGKVRRLGRSDHSRLQQDMAWQVAEMFVRDVISVTMAEDNTPDPVAVKSTKVSTLQSSTRDNCVDVNVPDVSLELNGDMVRLYTA